MAKRKQAKTVGTDAAEMGVSPKKQHKKAKAPPPQPQPQPVESPKKVKSSKAKNSHDSSASKAPAPPSPNRSVSRDLSPNASPTKKNKTLKKVKQSPPKIVFKDDSDLEEEADIAEEEDVASPLAAVTNELPFALTDVPKEHIVVLLKLLERQVPEKDSMPPRKRLKRLDWQKIAFADYTPEQCMLLWSMIQKKQRQHRSVFELLTDAKVWLNSPWKVAKPNKHPDFPKHPKSAFLLFLEDKKAEFMGENKDLRVTELAKLGGVRYNALSEAERTRYLVRATQLKAKFDEQVEVFYKKHPDLRVVVEPKHQVGPRKPHTPFTLFMLEHLAKEDHVSDKLAFKAASKTTWNNMKPRKKLLWIRRSMEEYKTYQEQAAVYNFQHPNHPLKMMKTVLSKEERDILDKAEGKPTKPPVSTWKYFMAEMNKTPEFADMAAKDRMKAVAAKWQELPKDAKEVYDKELHSMQQKYQKDYQVYLEKLPEEERLKLQQATKSKQKTKKPEKREKQKAVSKRDVSMSAVPKHWSTMSDADKTVYMSALSRVRDYFEAKLTDSIHEENPQEASDDEEEENQSKYKNAKAATSSSSDSEEDSSDSD